MHCKVAVTWEGSRVNQCPYWWHRMERRAQGGSGSQVIWIFSEWHPTWLVWKPLNLLSLFAIEISSFPQAKLLLKVNGNRELGHVSLYFFSLSNQDKGFIWTFLFEEEQHLNEMWSRLEILRIWNFPDTQMNETMPWRIRREIILNKNIAI